MLHLLMNINIKKGMIKMSDEKNNKIYGFILIMILVIIVGSIGYFCIESIIGNKGYKENLNTIKSGVDIELNSLQSVKKELPFTLCDAVYFVKCEYGDSSNSNIYELLKSDPKKCIDTISESVYGQVYAMQIGLNKSDTESSSDLITVFEWDREQSKLITSEESNLKSKIEDNLSSPQLMIANKLDKKLSEENIEIKLGSQKIKETSETITFTGLTTTNKILTFVYDLKSTESGLMDLQIDSEKFDIK